MISPGHTGGPETRQFRQELFCGCKVGIPGQPVYGKKRVSDRCPWATYSFFLFLFVSFCFFLLSFYLSFIFAQLVILNTKREK